MKIISVCSCLLMLASLSGCFALVAGGAAGGATGYYVEKQDEKDDHYLSHNGDDAPIAARVRQRFADDPQLAPLNLGVDSENGTITLSGSVPNGAMAERAIDMARSTGGVIGVRSELAVH